MLDTILRILAVITSLMIATTPWIYPRYSLFVRNAEKGLQLLRKARIEEGDVEAGYLEEGEPGFSEILKSAEVAYGKTGDFERIWVAWGPPPEIGDFAELGKMFGIGDNGVVYAEDSVGITHQLRYNPGNPNSVYRLDFLRAGISQIAEHRSQKLTSGLAVIWATFSIVVIVI